MLQLLIPHECHILQHESTFYCVNKQRYGCVALNQAPAPTYND